MVVGSGTGYATAGKPDIRPNGSERMVKYSRACYLRDRPYSEITPSDLLPGPPVGPSDPANLNRPTEQLYSRKFKGSCRAVRNSGGVQGATRIRINVDSL